MVTELCGLLDNLMHTDKPGPGPLEAILKQHKVHDQEIPSIVQFIHKCLALDPRKRQSADQLLSDPWLAGV
jgi:serine/threonine protein kinase